MTRLFVGNFSFEQSLSGGDHLSRPVARLEAELAWIWLAVACEGDEILCPVELDEGDWGRFMEMGCPPIRALTLAQLSQSKAAQLVPWGWTPKVRAVAQSLRIPIQAPDQQVVRRVNARQFGFESSRQLDDLLPGEGLACNVEEAASLVSRICQFGQRWIIKPNLGQAGRGQIRGEGPLEDKNIATVQRMIARSGVVHVEPELNAVMEVGGQWEIPVAGEPRLVGLTRLHSRGNGSYAGTGFDLSFLPETHKERLISLQSSAVAGLQREGYFGPVGIDAMVFQSQNEMRVRAIQDLNARWTMGRIAWEWNQRWQNEFSRSQSERESDGRGRSGDFDQIRAFTHSGCWVTAESSPSAMAVRLSPVSMSDLPVLNQIWWEPPR